MTFDVFDDRQRQLIFSGPAQRVVSLVPSETFNVAALGAAGALVGRTDYCELPEEIVARLPSVGGPGDARSSDILDLAPDLVLANQEDNSRDCLLRLVEAGVRD